MSGHHVAPLSILSCALALMMALPAAATPVTLSPTSGNVFGVYGRTSVTIHNGAAQNVIAGAFDVTSSSALPDLGTRFAAWCLDIGRNLSLPSQYDVTSTPFQADPLTAVQQGAIRTLFNIAVARDILRALPGTTAEADANSAGLQLALWDVVNDTDRNVNGGTFRVTSNSDASNDAERVANDLLAQIATWTGTNRVHLTFLESQDTRPHDGIRDSQNLVAFAPVPVPAAGALLLAALAGLGVWRRRRQAGAA